MSDFVEREEGETVCISDLQRGHKFILGDVLYVMLNPKRVYNVCVVTGEWSGTLEHLDANTKVFKPKLIKLFIVSEEACDEV